MSSLDAQGEERKKRLAQLRSLKRRQDAEGEHAAAMAIAQQGGGTADEILERGIKLSGRNFDVEERAPKMGFTHAPNEGQETVEERAMEIVDAVKAQQTEEEAAEKPIDLFNLQPKKPNWDLKRDVDKKLQRLKPRTKSAIAKLVQERINAAKYGKEDSEGQATNTAVEEKLAELVREREKEKGEDDEDEGWAIVVYIYTLFLLLFYSFFFLFFPTLFLVVLVRWAGLSAFKIIPWLLYTFIDNKGN